MLNAQNDQSAAGFMYSSGKTRDGFVLRTDTAPMANSTYSFDYFIAE